MGPVGFRIGGKQHPLQRLEASIVVHGWFPGSFSARGTTAARRAPEAAVPRKAFMDAAIVFGL